MSRRGFHWHTVLSNDTRCDTVPHCRDPEMPRDSPRMVTAEALCYAVPPGRLCAFPSGNQPTLDPQRIPVSYLAGPTRFSAKRCLLGLRYTRLRSVRSGGLRSLVFGNRQSVSDAAGKVTKKRLSPCLRTPKAHSEGPHLASLLKNCVLSLCEVTLRRLSPA